MTKSARVKGILDSESQKNVIVSFSMNALPVAKKWEKKAPSPTYRIKAVNQHGSGPFSNAAYASIPEITFSQLSLPIAADTTFNLNQPQFA